MSTEIGKEYDEMEGMQKLERQVTALTKIFQTLGENINNKQIKQLSTIYARTEKNLKLDSHHHDLRVKQIDAQKKATIEAFSERQKEIRQTKALTKAMKTQASAYDKVFKSLGGGGNSIGGAFNMMTGKLTQIAKTNKALFDADKAFQKRYKDTGIFDSKLKEQVDMAEKDFRVQTFNSKTLQGLAGRLTKLADFMEKHQGKFLLGAGIASVLIGIIGKALNVAPMFQAMFKLMQLAVNMILMPIGTFIGAMIKPFLLMVITTLAPLFQEAMKKAMAVGTAVGNFLMNQGSFASIINALMLDTSGNTTIQEPTTSSEKTMDQVVGVGATAAIVASSLYAVKKIVPVLTSKLPTNFFGANNVLKGSGTANTGTGTVYNAQGQIVPKEVKPASLKTNTLKNIGKVALPLLAFELLGGGEWLENFFRKGVRDLSGANDDHNLVYSQGNDLRGGGIGTRDQLWKSKGQTSAFSANTPTFEAMNAWTTKLGITNKKWMEDDEDRNRIGNYLNSDVIDPFNPISNVAELTKEGAGKMVEAMTHVQLLEEATQHMAVSSVGMEGKMKEIMDYYIMMKEDGKTAQQAMTNTAENFTHADATITAKLAQWVSAARVATYGEKKSKKPLIEALAAQNQYGYAQGIGDQGHTGWGNAIGLGSLLVESGSSEQTAAQKLKERMEAEAQRAKENYDKLAAGNRMLYDQIYDTKETTPSGHKYPTGFDSTGKTRAQMEQEYIDSGVNPQNTNNNTSNIPLLSTGGLDWNSYLNTNYGGGQINEPVFGIGRSGRTYSFGEHGSETVTPNGGGGGGITINIAKIEKNADFEQLKPMIQRWILEANSRRGMI